MVLIKVGLAILTPITIFATSNVEAIHLPIYRRDGRLSKHEPANLSSLAGVLKQVEVRYARSYRDVEHNGLVRRWHQKDPTIEDVAMFDDLGQAGTWYAPITIGDPAQKLEFDLDMLHPDFFTLMTTSGNGQRYNTTDSNTHGEHDFAWLR